jgi:hypothetical protein
MGNNFEGSGCGLTQNTVLEFVWKDWGKYGKSEPRLKPSTPKYKCRVLPLD